MIKEIIESISEGVNEPIEQTINDLNQSIDRMIKNKDKKGLDIMVKELDKILKGMK